MVQIQVDPVHPPFSVMLPKIFGYCHQSEKGMCVGTVQGASLHCGGGWGTHTQVTDIDAEEFRQLDGCVKHCVGQEHRLMWPGGVSRSIGSLRGSKLKP